MVCPTQIPFEISGLVVQDPFQMPCSKWLTCQKLATEITTLHHKTRHWWQNGTHGSFVITQADFHIKLINPLRAHDFV